MLATMLLVALSQATARPPAGVPDPHTMALWLFDEPQYMNMTLTDAGVNLYDLRLLAGGSMVPARFGNGLKVTAMGGPPVSLVTEATRFDVGLTNSVDSHVPEARPVYEPAKLFKALSSDAWTVEFWLKLEQIPAHDATLFELGHGTTPLLAARVAAGGESVRVSQGDVGVWDCPLGGVSLSDGAWHHFALTRQGSPDTLGLWLDGRRQAAPALVAKTAPQADPSERPGLVGLIYADAEKHWPVGVRVASHPDFYAGTKTLFSKIAYAQRWQGLLRSPASGDVEFSVQTDNPVSLTIDGQKIIDAPTSATAASGHCALNQGQLHEVTLEYLEDGGETATRLWWRLPGQDGWGLVPDGVFVHRQADLATALEAPRAFADRLKQTPEALKGWVAPDYDRKASPDVPGIVEGLIRAPYLSLGGETLAAGGLDVTLDELRVSDVARYTTDFTPPGTFSRNEGPAAPQPTVATSEPLLFAETNPRESAATPVVLGSRKHVFLDDVMIDARRGVQFKMQPPQMDQPTDMRNDRPWENSAPSFFGDSCLYDYDGTVRFMYNNATMWEGKIGTAVYCLATSTDGLHFEKPVVGLNDWNGSRENNIVMRLPVQGRFFEDTRPGIAPEERFKFSAYYINRGLYLFTSPDGLAWRRNETMMLPFDCGGGVEMMWDDQRGLYTAFIRHEGWVFMREPYGRAVAFSETREPFKPWPFRKLDRPIPRYESWDLPSVTEELPTNFEPYKTWCPKAPDLRDGQIYRTRGRKYPWAPDAYVAFPWRLCGIPDHEQRRTDLAVSRDGVNWTFYDEPYLPFGIEYAGAKVVESLGMDSLIRRGDEIWQYAELRFSGHLGGQVKGNPEQDVMLRYKQRLDGFVAMQAGEKSGWAVTRPFIFEGNRLELNIAAAGTARVALLGANEAELPGFSLTECDPIRADSTHHEVTWSGHPDVSGLAGKAVRLRFELQDARVFAFQFHPASATSH